MIVNWDLESTVGSKVVEVLSFFISRMALRLPMNVVRIGSLDMRTSDLSQHTCRVPVLMTELQCTSCLEDVVWYLSDRLLTFMEIGASLAYPVHRTMPSLSLL